SSERLRRQVGSDRRGAHPDYRCRHQNLYLRSIWFPFLCPHRKLGRAAIQGRKAPAMTSSAKLAPVNQKKPAAVSRNIGVSCRLVKSRVINDCFKKTQHAGYAHTL